MYLPLTVPSESVYVRSRVADPFVVWRMVMKGVPTELNTFAAAAIRISPAEQARRRN